MPGLAPLVLTNMNTGLQHLAGVMFRTRRINNDPGILLNACPWCTRPLVFDLKLKSQRANGESRKRRNTTQKSATNKTKT